MEKDETKSLMPRLSEPVERIPSGARAAEGERGGVQPSDYEEYMCQRFGGEWCGG